MDLTAVNAESVAGNGDDTFDVTFRRIARVAEDDNIPAFNRFQPIHELVDEDSFLIFERRHHADAFDFYRLVEKNDDECRDGKRDEEVAQPNGQSSSQACRRGRRRLAVGGGRWIRRNLRWDGFGHAPLLYTEPNRERRVVREVMPMVTNPWEISGARRAVIISLRRGNP